MLAGSSPSGPASTDSSRATSLVVVAIGPRWSRKASIGNAPV
jgi:hypothetical protein